MRSCPQCASPASSHNAFCGSCGAALPVHGTQAASSDAQLGRVLGGRFRMEAKLGEGACGAVYRATHTALQRPVAVKLLHANMAHQPEALARFFREATTAGALSHPHLIPILDCGQTDEGVPYLVMDYLTGATLEEVLQAEPEHRLPPSRALDIAMQVTRGLRHVHAHGVVHRDLKPSNVMLTERDGDPEWAVLVDFGVAKVLADPMTRPGMVLGTLGFIAPETLLTGECGPPSDIYALGATLFEALAGERLLEGTDEQVMFRQLHGTLPTLAELRPEMAGVEHIDALLQRLLHRDPVQRPSAAEVLVVLKQIRAQLPRRSAEGEMIAQTVLLADRRGAAETVLLQPTQQLALEERRTRLLKDVLSVDQLSARLRELAEAITEESSAALQRGPIPAEAQPLLQHLANLAQGELQVEHDLALVKERIRDHRAALMRQQQQLQVRVFDCSRRLSDRATAAGVRAMLEAERLDLERRIHEFGQRFDLELHARRFELLSRLFKVQRERQRALLDLARRLIANRTSPLPSARRQHLEDLVEEMSDTLTLLGRHERRG